MQTGQRLSEKMTFNKSNHHHLITRTGKIYIFAAIIFLILGIVRGELIATLCGATLLLFSSLSFIHSFFTYIVIKKIEVDLTLKNSTVFEFTLNHKSKKQHFSLFFLSQLQYCIDYSTSLQKNDGRLFSICIPLDKNKNRYEIKLPARGKYYSSSAYIKIQDFPCFFCFTITQSSTSQIEPLTVPASSQKLIPNKFENIKTSVANGKSTFRRSEELYESRTYLPGDDPRKINWKVFAHSGILSLRQGELLPPPANNYYLLINTFYGNQPKLKTEACFDILINRIAFIGETLLQQNKTITIVTENQNGEIVQIALSPNTLNLSERLLEFLALPQITRREFSLHQKLLSLPQKTSILFFTLPFISLNVPLHTNSSQNLTICLGPVLDQPTQNSKKNSLKTFFFIQKEDYPTKNVLNLNEDISSKYFTLKKKGLNVIKI